LDLIVLFGSQAKGRAMAGSDVDIAVRAINRPWGDWDWEFRVEEALSNAIWVDGSEVDVVFLNGAAPLLMFQVAQSGQVLFEKEWGTLSDFRSYAARMYYDNEPRLRRQAEYLRERFA
jgi:predicted nucleotidyltransferase